MDDVYGYIGIMFGSWIFCVSSFSYPFFAVRYLIAKMPVKRLICGKPLDTLINRVGPLCFQKVFPQMTTHHRAQSTHTHTRCVISLTLRKWLGLYLQQQNLHSIFHQNPIIYCRFVVCNSFFVEF